MIDRLPDLSSILETVAAEQPLITAVTNSVTVNEVANVILQWGGLPVMSEDRREVDEMVHSAAGVLLNMGTVSTDEEQTLIAAGHAGTAHDRPIVFDPVGAGATTTRTRVAQRILSEVEPTIINGNYGEISALVGSESTVKGVESIGQYDEIATTAITCAQETDAIVIASGPTDIVADSERAYAVDVGDPMLGSFVGSGCMLGGSVATFAGALTEPLQAGLLGTAAFGLAGEYATTLEYQGPASYQTAVLDAVAGLADRDVTPLETHIELAAEV